MSHASLAIPETLRYIVSLIALFHKWSFRLALIVISIAAIVAIPFYVRMARHRHDQRMQSSCSNHFSQLLFLVKDFVDQEATFPSETDARRVFAKMLGTNAPYGDWITSYQSACPEAFLRDESIGYVFVADGLATKTVKEQSAVIFFCPADSHQRSVQGCKAMWGNHWRSNISNSEMIQLLRLELGRAKTGIVPYSTNAQALMARELATRETYARKQ